MDIIFICGSLEPGRDGVGDYTRRLAGELIKKGYASGIISLNEREISSEINSYQKSAEVHIPVLRLPARVNFKQRYQKATSWINDRNPQWISLQYVPFAFHTKGLHYGMSKFLRILRKEKKWHIMFHELWVGMNSNSTLKLKLWGFIQKHMIKNMLRELNPEFIHTNTLFYQEQLRLLGFESDYLPIFPNIEKEDNAEMINIKRNTKEIYLIIFGTIQPNVPIKQFSKEIFEFGKKNDITFILRIVGRSGNELNFWKEIWMGVGLQVELYGERDESYISRLLKRSSIGITTNPIGLIEKSGTVAAMLQHNLPVLCLSQFWHLKEKIRFKPLPGVSEYNINNLQLCLEGKVSFYFYNSVSTVSTQFINHIFHRKPIMNN